jgi:hypothetical protein
MQQAALTISQLFTDYQTADAEKRRIYALADQSDDGGCDAADACDAAYDAAEAVADAILATPAHSYTHLAIKARVLLARGTDLADLLYYRPNDLSRFIQEVRNIAGSL